jgi:hypothetical protein
MYYTPHHHINNKFGMFVSYTTHEHSEYIVNIDMCVVLHNDTSGGHQHYTACLVRLMVTVSPPTISTAKQSMNRTSKSASMPVRSLKRCLLAGISCTAGGSVGGALGNRLATGSMLRSRDDEAPADIVGKAEPAGARPRRALSQWLRTISIVS